VFAPLPQVRREVDVTGGPSAPATSAAGYAAGWAQGVAAAAAGERAALAAHAEAAETQRAQLAGAVARALAALDDAAAQMRAHAVPAVDATADALVAAAADLAEVLVGHELTEAEGRGRRALARALAAAPAHDDVTVSLHPDDLAVLGDLAGPDAPAGASGRDVRLAADPALAPGDAVAHYPGGRVDARVATGLARMRAGLRSEVRA
jgi:flagellar assembly protein FliH